ncbi:MAG: HD domain-containing protein [Treponema sp.]|nr:HD domain-containing protein [Treponema sp.]
MAIYKPKILFFYSTDIKIPYLEKYEIFYDIIKTNNTDEAVLLSFKELSSLSAIIIDDSDNENIFEVLNKFHSMDIFRTVPGIIISGNKDSEYISKAFDFGIFDYFSKSLDFNIAKQKIYKIIELFKNKNQLEQIFNQQMLTIRTQEDELKENQWNIIETLGQALESRDIESGNHCYRMKEIAETFAKYLSLKYPKYMITDVTVKNIAKVTPLHDIGKIAIPDRILLKPESAGRLTNDEFEIMKTHTIAGCRLIDSIPNFKESSLYRFSYNICRHHHERWDGNGYPDRLKGPDIPIEAQIVALADVFDALLCKRVYKPSFTLETTKNMILNGECGAFNPDLIECLKNCADDIYKRIYENKSLV